MSRMLDVVAVALALECVGWGIACIKVLVDPPEHLAPEAIGWRLGRTVFFGVLAALIFLRQP